MTDNRCARFFSTVGFLAGFCLVSLGILALTGSRVDPFVSWVMKIVGKSSSVPDWSDVKGIVGLFFLKLGILTSIASVAFHHLNRRPFILLFVLLSASYFSFGTIRNWPYKIESDGKYYYQYLISMFFDGDLDFTNNYNTPKYDFMEQEIDNYNLRQTRNENTGRPVNHFTCGPALLWFPFFLVSYISARLLNMIQFPTIPLDGWSLYFQYTVMFSAVIYSMLALYLIYRLLSKYFAGKASLIATILILAGSNWIYYVIFEPSMSHVYDITTMVVYLYLLDYCLGKDSALIGGLLGLVGGIHVLVRTQNVATIIIFSLYLMFRTLRKSRKAVEQPGVPVFLSYAAALFVSILPLLLINNYLYGSPLFIPQGADFIDPTRPHMLEVLFSLHNGLFSHHPFLLVGLFGFALFLLEAVAKKKEDRFFLMVLLASFIIQLYINSIAGDWFAGHSFGQRRMISQYFLLAMGLAYVLNAISAHRPRFYTRFIPKIATILVVLNLYLMFIHVFIWDYDEPHNIVYWMFRYIPERLFGL